MKMGLATGVGSLDMTREKRLYLVGGLGSTVRD